MENEIDVTKGYKAFEPGLICRGKQYAENTTFEEAGGEICSSGMMHYCVNPIDVLDYYPLVTDGGDITDFAEVQSENAPITDDYKKYATNKLHIGAKLDLKGFINASVNFLHETTTFSPSDTSSGDGAKIGSSGDGAKIGSSGDEAQIGSSGFRAKIGSSGDGAKIGSSGDRAQIGSSGDRAKIGSSGDEAQIGSSGDWAQIGSSGDWAKIGSSGDWAQIGSSGDWAVVAAIGINSAIKAKTGSWITLAEYDDEGKPLCVRSARIDGVTLKPDVFYLLKGGEFVEYGDDQ